MRNDVLLCEVCVWGGGLFYVVQCHTLGLSMGCFYLTRFSCC